MLVFIPTSTVSTPEIRITIPLGPLYAGTSSFTLICTTFLNSAIDSRVSLEDMKIMWFSADTELSNSDAQVTVAPITGSQPMFNSNLTLSPLSIVDTRFTCRANVMSPSGVNLITGSEIGEQTVTISVQGN